MRSIDLNPIGDFVAAPPLYLRQGSALPGKHLHKLAALPPPAEPSFDRAVMTQRYAYKSLQRTNFGVLSLTTSAFVLTSN